MYILLTLFCASLIGIIFMVGRKLAMLQNIELPLSSDATLQTKILEEWKHFTLRNIKKHSYVGLVTTIRFYVRSSNLLKRKYQEVKVIIKYIRYRKSKGSPEQKLEINNFLKMISEYKNKIRKIKHMIREEEKKQ